MVFLLLDQGADIDARSDEDRTPLHLAVAQGSAEMVSLLLDQGADIDARSDEGRTPLHLAVAQGSAEMVSLLLDRGADHDVRDKSRRTPLLLAIYSNSPANVIRLLRDEENKIPLKIREAINLGNLNGLRLLLDQGADIEVKYTDGWTPLHLAVREGNVEMVRLLLDWGADFNAKNDNDRTPLHLSALWGFVDVVSLLLNRGADIEVKDIKGQTPLDITSRSNKNKLEIASLLIRHGALVTESAIAAASDDEMRNFLVGMAERPRLSFEFEKAFDIRKASGADYSNGSVTVELQMLGEDGQWKTVAPEVVRWDLPFALFRAVAIE